MNVSDITITSLETIDAFDIVTGGYLFTLDELQNATIAQSQEKTDITGKQGRKLSSLKNKTTEVMWNDYLIVAENQAVTTYKAVGTTGNEVEAVHIKNTDGTLGKTLTQDATVGTDTFTYDPATKTLTFDDGVIADGTEVVVYYKRQIQASVLNNMSDTYSGKCALYINALAEDKCANIYRIQFFIPKADFNGEFSIEMGDNQTVHAFEAESLAGAGCGYHNQSGQLFTYTVFGANAEDVVDEGGVENP